MLIQALAAYADVYLKKEQDDLAFEEKPMQYMVQLAPNGRFLGIQERTQTVNKGSEKKPKMADVARTMLVPKSPVNRNSGVHPMIGCDAIQYVLGVDEVWTAPNDVEKHTRHFLSFQDFIAKAAEKTADPALYACVAFYRNDADLIKARADLAARKPKPGMLVALGIEAGLDSKLSSGPVIHFPAVKAFWNSYYSEKFNAERLVKDPSDENKNWETICLISGERGSVMATHDKIKGASNIGGQAAGVALMSFDKEAFRSYGWLQNFNSPVSPNRAMAYVLAMNDLMRPGEHRIGRTVGKSVRTRSDHGGLACLYWTREPSDDDPFDLTEKAEPEQVSRLLHSPLIGNADPASGFDHENDFYFLAVSGNGGRLVIRDWHRNSLKHVKENLRDWFNSVRIADVFNGGKTSAPPKLWELIQGISPPRAEDRDPVNAERSMALLRRALFGAPLGYGPLAAALGRLRLAKGKERLQTPRMGVIRICLNDLSKRQNHGGQVMSEALNENESHPAYICGRILAVFEELQYAAQGDVNVSIVDRYYGLASTFPQQAFPKLETLSKAHLKKLRRDKPGARVNIERRIDALAEMLVPHGAKYPGQLNLENQGRFAIGFHHQKAESQARKQEYSDKKAADSASESTTLL